MHRYLLLGLSVLVIVSCATETEIPATTTTTTAMTTTATPPTPTTVAPTPMTIEQTIDVEIRNGEIAGPERFQVDQGEKMEITVLSDTPYEIHVHGYDLRYDLVPEEPHTIEFIADVPGIFEVETHPDHLILFEIEVGG